MRAAIATMLLLAAACGPGGSGGQMATHLPGDRDGDGDKKPPREVKDPWAGRAGMIPPPARVPARPLPLPAVHRFTLSNGLRVIVAERHDLPTMSLQLAIKVGRAHAPRDQMGIEQLTAQLLDQGTRTRTADAIRAELDRTGLAVLAQASFENTLLSCAGISAQLASCLKLMPDLIANPNFPEAAVTGARRELRNAAVRRTQDPGQLAALHFQNLLWGEEHVRGWSMSAATVDAIARKDVVAWHARWFKPNNAVLSIAGDVDATRLKTELEAAFRGWKKGNLPAAPQYKVVDRSAPVARLIDWPGLPQGHIRVGHAGISHRDPDFEATVVFTHALTERLRKRVKRERGTGAGATAGFDRNLDTGIYVVSGFSRPDDAMAVVRAALQEMTALAEGGPTRAEVDGAVMQAIGAYGLRYETAADLANELLAAELHGLDDAAVRGYPLALDKVTPEAARAAAGRVLEPEAPVLVIVGDAEKIGAQLEAVGVAYERISAAEPVASYDRDPQPADPKKAAVEGRKLLDRALAVKGGAARLRGMKSLLLDGKAEGSYAGQPFTAEVTRTYLAPDKVRRDLVRTQGKDKVYSSVVLAGNEAWAQEKAGDKVNAGELPGHFVVALKAQLWRDPDLVLLRHLDRKIQVAALPPRTVLGSPCHVVRVTRQDGVSATLYLDQKSFLLRQMIYRSEDSRAVETYADYRPIKGIQMAHRRVTTEGMTSFDVTMEKIAIDEPVAPGLFEKPKK